jgi:hypothetical protein
MAKTVLGIAFTPGLIQVVEVYADQKSAKALKAAEFKLPEGEALKAPAALGLEFGQFLKQNKFGARIAVAGLPTQWLLLKEKTVPQMSAENLAGMLRLQAERDFSLDPQDLSLDYCAGESDEPGGRPVLVVATLRQRIDQIVALLKAAGVSLRAITSSALALAEETGAEALLSAGPSGTELMLRTRGNLRVPSVLSSAPAEGPLWIVSAGPEARRTLAMRAVDPATVVALWNGAGGELGNVEDLSRTLKMTAREVRQLNGLDASSIPNAPRYGHALALALQQRSGETPAVNFLRSKLDIKEPGKFAGVRWWMAAAALIVVGVLGWLGLSWYLGRAELADLKKRGDERKAAMEKTKAFNATFAELDEWQDKRTRVLDCMKELEKMMPAGEAWLSNLSVEEDFRCVMSGRAVRRDTFMDVFKKIDNYDRFRDVKLVFMQQPDVKKPEVQFAVSFLYWKR